MNTLPGVVRSRPYRSSANAVFPSTNDFVCTDSADAISPDLKPNPAMMIVIMPKVPPTEHILPGPKLFCHNLMPFLSIHPLSIIFDGSTFQMLQKPTIGVPTAYSVMLAPPADETFGALRAGVGQQHEYTPPSC